MKYYTLILFLFSLFGMMMISTMAHEKYHEYQYRELTDGNICLLEYPSFDGSFTFNIPQTNAKSEIPAYLVGWLINIIFIVCIVNFWIDTQERIL